MPTLSEDNMTLTLENGDVYTSTSVISKSSSGGKRNRKEANKTRKNKQEGGKKKLSGFMKFSKQERPNIMKENPGFEFTQVGKKLGEKWRALSDAQKKSYA